VDATGTLQAEYTYDAWGTVLSATGYLAGANPIRYRGYYYDSEIGSYYLQTRYYSTKWKRFWNADCMFIAGRDVLNAANMYSYCNGNPVMYKDPTGMGIFDDPAAFFSELSWLGQNILWAFGDEGVNVFLTLFNGELLSNWTGYAGGLLSEFYILTNKAFNNSSGTFSTFVDNIVNGMNEAFNRFSVWLQSQRETAIPYSGGGIGVIIGMIGIVLDRMAETDSFMDYAARFIEIIDIIVGVLM